MSRFFCMGPSRKSERRSWWHHRVCPQGEDKPSPLLWTDWLLARSIVGESCLFHTKRLRDGLVVNRPPKLGEDKPSPLLWTDWLLARSIVGESCLFHTKRLSD